VESVPDYRRLNLRADEQNTNADTEADVAPLPRIMREQFKRLKTQGKGITDVLRENNAASVAEIRSVLERLPVKLSASEVKALVALSGGDVSPSMVEIGQSQVRTAILDDLTAYRQSQSATASTPAAVWVQDALSRYSAWLGRTGVR
jgi:hypothetical protein